MEPVRDMISARVAGVKDCPRTLIWPRVGARSPSSIFIVVDFPEPLGPRKPYTVPRGTTRFRPSTTVRSPKVFVRSRVRMTASSADPADGALTCGTGTD